MKTMRILLLAALGVLAACSSKPQRDPAYAAVRPNPPPPAAQFTGSIYHTGTAVALFEDARARRVGDMLTVVLTEKTQASKNATTKTKKDSKVDMPAPTVFGKGVTYHGRPILSADIQQGREFSGAGDSSQGNSLSGSITVTVAEVLSNGNLVVRGEKLLTLNQGDEQIRIAGIVRPADIRPDNTILSTQVADAQVSYAGTGALADANSQGWMSRFFNSSWWPF